MKNYSFNANQAFDFGVRWLCEDFIGHWGILHRFGFVGGLMY